MSTLPGPATSTAVTTVRAPWVQAPLLPELTSSASGPAEAARWLSSSTSLVTSLSPSSPLINGTGTAGPAARRPDEAALTRVLRGLYVQCLLTGHHTLTAKERAWASQTLSALLTSALAVPGPSVPEGTAPTSHQEGAP